MGKGRNIRSVETFRRYSKISTKMLCAGQRGIVEILCSGEMSVCRNLFPRRSCRSSSRREVYHLLQMRRECDLRNSREV